MTDLGSKRRLLDASCEIAYRAGRAILEVYGRADLVVERKSDDSPLTEADRVSHDIISRELAKLDSRLPILSEESLPADHATRRTWASYWLVDPLDGTKEFLKRNGEFTVNIALVEAQRAVLGTVYAPVLERMYSGVVGMGRCASSAVAAIRHPSLRPTCRRCRRMT
jgi:3'(2'), 5'-bisphosphate nucleotidase